MGRWRARRALRGAPTLEPEGDPAVLARFLVTQSGRERARRSTWGEPGAFCPREFSSYSQHGEDGAIRDLFVRLDGAERAGTFVEIGAADGSENCTRALIERGWTGMWIEGEPSLAGTARALVDARAVDVVNEYVDRGSIVALSRRWPDDLDLLVIDVDGNDYWFCESALQRSKPRVIVAEYNGAFGPRTRWVAGYHPDRRWDESVDHGASLAAFADLAAAHRYQLVYCEESGTNAFFVRRDLAARFPEIPPELLFQPPIHKLPNGHPVARPRWTPTSPTSSGRDVGLGLTWLESDAAAPGEPLYAIATLTNRGTVPVGNGTPAPTLLTWAWLDDAPIQAEPTRVSVVPWSLPPGSSLALPARILTPAVPRLRHLRLAVVQEGVRWFDETVTLPLRIGLGQER
jgi:hypothetical protein